MNELTPTERRALRAAAHHIEPTVTIASNGLSPNVLKEIDVSLRAHELIKVKLHGIERTKRDTLLAQVSAELDCAPVQHIGNILVLWRPLDKENAAQSKATRRKATAAPKTKKQAAAALERKTARGK